MHIDRRGRRASAAPAPAAARGTARSAATTSSSDGFASRSTDTLSVWPSIDGHASRLRADDDRVRRTTASLQRPEDLLRLALDLLFFAARCTGRRCRGCRATARPDSPAPDTACIVVTITRRRPNWRSGASAIASTTVEQFGLVTIAPRPAAFAALAREQREVVGVDFGDQQRDERDPCGSCARC